MSHHDINITLKKVVAGNQKTKTLNDEEKTIVQTGTPSDCEPRNLGASFFTLQDIPTDGVYIQVESGGILWSCYLTNSDIQAVLVAKPGEKIIAESWNASPKK